MICCLIADTWLPRACCCCFFVAGLLLLLDLLLRPLAVQPSGWYLTISVLSPDYLGAISRRHLAAAAAVAAALAVAALLLLACRFLLLAAFCFVLHLLPL